MKERDLPASFWQQPQRPSSNIRLELPATQRDVLFDTRTMFIRIPTPPDTNLLFSLFKILDQSMTTRNHIASSKHSESSRLTSTDSDRYERRRRRLNRNREMIKDQGSTIISHNNNNNNSNQVPDLNPSSAMDEDQGGNVIHSANADVDDDDNAFGNNRPTEHHHHHHHPDQCFSDDDPYLCVGSKDRRVGGQHQHQTPRIRGGADNFSDLLSDLVVNL